MPSPAMKALLIFAAAVAVSSCGNRITETQLAFPNASDLKPEAEPPFPVEALGDGPEADAAEDRWWNDVLAWGRMGWGNVRRTCEWAETMGKELPDGWCGE